jgi:hypothetical protein
MRFYTQVHEACCGINLPARTMYVCILNRDGEIMLHWNMPTTARPFSRPLLLIARISWWPWHAG